MRSLTVLLGCALLHSLTWSALPVNAGVAGSEFQGTVYNNYGQTIPLRLQFLTDGTSLNTEVQPTGTYTFYGTYVERDFILVSIWQVIEADASPDRYARVNGISFFGFLTTVQTTHDEIDLVASGIAVRVGFAPRSPQTHDSSSEATSGGNGH